MTNDTNFHGPGQERNCTGGTKESETWRFPHPASEKPVRLRVMSMALCPPTASVPSQSDINSPLIDPTLRLLTGRLTRRNVRPAGKQKPLNPSHHAAVSLPPPHREESHVMMSSFIRRRIAELHFGPDVQADGMFSCFLEIRFYGFVNQSSRWERSQRDLDHTAE